MDTIVALASAPGKAGVSIVRVSGSAAWKVCEGLCGSSPPERVASLRTLRGVDGEEIDHALVLTFSNGRSFTGEELVEFHVHGSPAVVRAVLDFCTRYDGVRMAEPGEFTRRAFDAGKMTITQVEGLADLLNAETDLQRRQAVQLMGGGPESKLLSWRKGLLQALVYMEAGIDFSDEELPGNMEERAVYHLRSVLNAIEAELPGREFSERVREGFTVAIVGRVNVGKSTLLNALAGREAAITSEHAGTTRDVIELRMDLSGYPVTFLDTAGLRVSDDPVEAIGIKKGSERAKQADLRVYLKAEPSETITPEKASDIITLSKCDEWGLPGISGKTGDGIDDLVAKIIDRLGVMRATPTLFSRARHFSLLDEAARCLSEAIDNLEAGWRRQEVAAELVNSSVRSLDMIMGRIDVEEVLGGIFSSFCIGK